MSACRVFPDLAPGGGAVLVQFLRFMILINQLIPISLYVTLELVKVMQCTLLTWDLHMYHRASGTPFLCRTTTLNEELGQVQYVLSDKTGGLGAAKQPQPSQESNAGNTARVHSAQEVASILNILCSFPSSGKHSELDIS